MNDSAKDFSGETSKLRIVDFYEGYPCPQNLNATEERVVFLALTAHVKSPDGREFTLRIETPKYHETTEYRLSDEEALGGDDELVFLYPNNTIDPLDLHAILNDNPIIRAYLVEQKQV